MLRVEIQKRADRQRAQCIRRLTIYLREITLPLKLHTHCAQSITQKSQLTRIAMNHACLVVVPFWQ